jgi:hypothetical protein
MRVAFYLSLLFVVLVYAFVRGGGPERSVAAVLTTTLVINLLALSITPPTLSSIDYVPFFLDSASLVVFIAIALAARRFWPLCVASLQCLALMAHFTRMMDVDIHPVAYGTMQVASSYPLLLVLALGTFLHQRRLRSNGSDPSWRSSFPWSRHPTRMT